MSVVEDLADDLARATLSAMDETGDDRLHVAVAKVLGASSQTMEEAFLTAVRVRTAAARGQQFLETHLAEARQQPGAAGSTSKARGTGAE